MEQSTAQRRLAKSPPELWAQVSSEDALGRHLAPFGEIRITRTEPETTVAWEGDRASGTVQLEPAGWGTNLFRHRRPQPAPASPAPAAPALSQPAPGPEPTPPDPDPAPTPPAGGSMRMQSILAEVLDDPGAAHHRPFSRG